MMTNGQAFKIIEDYHLEVQPWFPSGWSAGRGCSWATHRPGFPQAYGKGKTLLEAVALCYEEIKAKGIQPAKRSPAQCAPQEPKP